MADYFFHRELESTLKKATQSISLIAGVYGDDNEEIKQEIKPEPLDKDNKDVETHVIDVEKDQEKSELQAMVDKLLKEKQTFQKDMIKFVDLQVEHQMLKSDKYTVERQLEELQVENQNLKYL